MDVRFRRALGASVTIAALAAGATPALARPSVSVSTVSSLDGSAGTLRGAVVNETARATRARVTISLHRRGTQRRVLGRTAVKVAARSSARYRVGVKLPSGLKRGTYYVSACTPSGAGAGLYGCATAEDEVLVKGGTPVRGSRAAAAYRRVARASAAEDCTSGAHTLSKPGMRVYPEMGNGGYLSIHTDVHNIYDAVNNVFLPGTHVDLQQRSTQCLKDFSLDFERSNADPVAGPDMTVGSVTINGQPAEFKFVQPTYPGDPNGQDDPDPLAHRASLTNPVSADNPNPPACNPAGDDEELQNQPCPANKLVITPAAPIPAGSDFTVTVNYTGRPGVHLDGDGSTEGWFRNDIPTGDGSFVTTEPVGTMAWMPLNNHPSVKPTYDFFDTVAYDAAAKDNRVAIGNGRLISTAINAADANFPTGSRTFHWKSPEPIASYLVENSMGFYSLDERFADSGVIYYQAQSIGIDAARQVTNKAIMDQQEDITLFQQKFNGPFPFSTDGVIVGIPRAGFEEEMQTKITFQRGRISLGTFHHENMHQWWGDNVSEGAYNLTFFKEGYATLSEVLHDARDEANDAGGMGTPAGDAAFEQTIVDAFDDGYNSNSTTFWRNAPSNPTAANLFSGSSTYDRPGLAYIALRAILGPDNFNAAGQEIQRTYGGGSITEPQLIAVFQKHLPNKSIGCRNKLDAFFKQWWDTPYSGPPSQGNKPQITGPGLAGPGFYDANGRCSDYQTDVPGDVRGDVPATLSLTLGGPATFGNFVPGVEDDYTATTSANVISTAGDATLTSTDPGHLMNGAFTLASPLQVAFSKSSWDAPVSNDAVTITFTQHIDADEALRTGSYSKTLTFTLSTTTP